MRRNRRWLPIALLALAALGAIGVAQIRDDGGSAGPSAAAPARDPLRYDTEYPAVGYSTAEPTDPIARLQRRIARGETRLRFDARRGYLDSLLEELDIDPASQVLVFSQTSLQGRRIGPQTPRAIYFDDEVYVAWVQQGPLEIASMDPNLGPVFYLLEQTEAPPVFERELARCLSCHDSYSLTGGGVPRFIVGSGYTGARGELVTHEGWILVTDRTPLKSRWGGWYVTGRHGDQVHLGNMIIRSFDDFQRLEELRVGNIDTLDALFDTRSYLTNTSDIVALMVLEHQVNVQNLIARVSYDARSAAPADLPAVVERAVEPLVQALLFVGEAPVTSPIAGDPGFVAQFASRALRDSQGRSLRDLDLTARLFRFPLSYLIYSAAFDALPGAVKHAVHARLAAVLRGDDQSEPFAHLSAADRAALLDILTQTSPEFAAL